MRNSLNNAANGKPHMMTNGNWPAERWIAVVVLMALGSLIAIRQGFRGVSVFGASVKVN